jgi:hypothetical protein
MATNPPVPPPPGTPPYAPPPPRKSSALKWILIGVGGFFLLIFLAVAGLGLFVVHKAKQAGLDTDLIKRNPALAVARMAIASNPNLEMVSTDEGRQVITVRDKQTGKVTTMSWDDAKKGKFTFNEDGKEAFSITSGGANGTMEMKSPDGTVKIGGNVKIPTWVPDYPGSDPKGVFSAQGKDGDTGSFAFKTKDASDKVMKYYRDELESSGLKITNNVTSQNGQSATGMLVAQDDVKRHTVTVIIGQESGQSSVSVNYATSK